MPERLRFLELILKYHQFDRYEKIRDRKIGCNARRLYLDQGSKIRGEHRKSLERLIELTDDGKFFDSRVHISIRDGTNVARAILEEPKSLDSLDTYGDTPLTLACSLGDLDTVSTLITSGADVNLINSRQLAPLNSACAGGFVDCVDQLLVASCDANARLAFRPPIHELIWSEVATDEKKEAILKLLNRHGADLGARSRFEDWPLQLSIVKGQDRVFQTLIDVGADVKIYKAFNGWTLLHYVASYGTLSSIQALQNVSPDLLDGEIPDKKNMTSIDVFKCSQYDYGVLSNPDWRKPTIEQATAFNDLIRQTRDPFLQQRIAAAQSSIKHLESQQRLLAISELHTVRQKLCDRRRFSEDEEVRLLCRRIRSEPLDECITGVRDWLETLVETLQTSPLMMRSWIDDFRDSSPPTIASSP
ncbi:hypothetical protein AA0119_g8851 [Alternaria tenuissima]|uniref:Ankyrin n=1 Tax=Alternaria tenuissima TaxID=119927 RepID=A0ABY0G1G5_9PLEO|nr:hypothetical protein AA0119_g8851 [Alternaria tenuissima]RYO10853.1 hypothetical protein AA0121_g10401 [Alternaria tenuissima]